MKENWLLEENHDLKHKSRPCTSLKQRHGVDVLEQSSQSLDVNLIENVRVLMKLKFQGKKMYTVKQLIRQIRFMQKSLSEDYAENQQKVHLVDCS